jgi:PadR family transcriptional regulator PadR
MAAMQEPTFLILTALADGPLHGYGLIREVGTLSGGRVKLRAGTLYGALDRLQESGQVELEREEVVDGRLRRYYRLTSDGTAALAAEASRMRESALIAEKRLRKQAITPTVRPATDGS